jgi:membrane peptidoglycan carboxypeptidase
MLVVLAGALLLSASSMAIAPRLWRLANAHQQDPIQLPEFQSLAQRTYVYDIEGNEIGVFELENSQPIDLNDVPEVVIQAFLSVEDNEFWSHRGVNVRSLFRATLSNFASDAPQQGASTITMQVAKNDYLAGLERDGRYKALQIIYAMRLERELTKEQILERYLNTVYFGNNAYGIAAAAETYFGKRVDQLRFVEAAFLAGLVRSPSGYDPISNPDRSRARFLQVLNRLVSDELLTEAEAEAFTEGPRAFVIPERTQSLPQRQVNRTYFTEAVRDYLLNRSNILGSSYQERYNRLFRGGLRIHTTLDPYLQEQAEVARDLLPDTLQGFDAALISLDTQTSAVRAMVGGRGFLPGQRELNLALAPSQTGSSIKIYVLAAAILAGAEDYDRINGLRGCVLPNPGNLAEPTFAIDGGVEGGIFTLREHSARSINCAFARLSQIVGLNRVVDLTYRMSESPYLYRGQSRSERRPIEPFASFATGANEMSTMDMAAGMQTIANRGEHHDPYYIDYIEDPDGRRLYTHVARGVQVLPPGVADLTVNILKDTLTSGTGRAELGRFAQQRPAAGKTGTQQDNTVATFVGSTPYLTTAVLVRDPARYTPMRNIAEFQADGVPRVQGGTYPARIWGAFMDKAHLFEPVTDWNEPPGPRRPPAALYLPGVECLYELVPVVPVVEDPVVRRPAQGPPSATVPSPGQGGSGNGTTTGPGDGSGDADSPTTSSTSTTSTTSTTTTTTEPPPPQLSLLPSGTTIPPDITDPRAPIPSAPLNVIVSNCAAPEEITNE